MHFSLFLRHRVGVEIREGEREIEGRREREGEGSVFYIYFCTRIQYSLQGSFFSSKFVLFECL